MTATLSIQSFCSIDILDIGLTMTIWLASWVSFLKLATTVVDPIFSELKSHLLLVKQMYSQPLHLAHELILHIQITKGWVDFNRVPRMKSPCWRRV